MKAFVFDVEGTLIDCARQILTSWRDTLQGFGLEVSEAELQRYAGMDGAEMLQRVLPAGTSERRRQVIVAAQGEHYRKAAGCLGVFADPANLLSKLPEIPTRPARAGR
jgi:phosphoglycolate phosphatase-like HAD superfamily hydrolase